MEVRQGPGRRRRRVLLAVAGTIVAVLALASPASALLGLLGIDDDLPLIGDVDGIIGDVLTGASEPLCDVTGALADQTADGTAAPVTGTAETVACNLDLLAYRFRTEWAINGPDGRTPGPTLVREHPALVGIPEAMNVDNDLEAELIGTLRPVSLREFVFEVRRTPFAQQSLPVRLEALIPGVDPALAGKTIAAGYDTKRTSAPRRFEIRLELKPPEPGTTSLGLDVVTEGAADSQALIAEVFDGEGPERPNAKGGRLGFSPVPGSLRADLELSTDGHTDVAVRSDRPTALDLSASLVDGEVTQELEADLQDLPAATPESPSLHAVYDKEGDDRQTVDIETAGPIDFVSGSYDRSAPAADGGEPEELHASLRLEEVPTRLIARQTGPESGDVSTAGSGAIDRADVGFAQGTQIEGLVEGPGDLESDDDGIRIVDPGGGAISLASRFFGVSEASFKGGDVPEVDLQAAPRELQVDVEQLPEGRTIEAEVEDLPAHLHLLADPLGGKFELDGFGQTIDRVHVRTEDDTPLFGRAKLVDGTLLAIPDELEVTIPDGDVKGVELSRAIGTVDVTVADDPDAPLQLAGGDSGLRFEDTLQRFGVHARVDGLRSVLAGPDTDVALKAEQPQPFDFNLLTRDADDADDDGDTGESIGIDGRIENLPAEVEVHANVRPPGSGPTVLDRDGSASVTYEASDEIDYLRVESGTLPLPEPADMLFVEAEGIPRELNTRIDDDLGCLLAEDATPEVCGDVLRFDAGGDEIEELRGRIHEADGVVPAFPTDRDIARFDNGFQQQDFLAAVQISGLRSVELDEPGDFVQAAFDVDKFDSRPLDIDVRTQEMGEFDPPGPLTPPIPVVLDPTIVDATIDKPAADTVVELGMGDATNLSYRAGESIDRIDLFADSNGLGYIDALLTDLPNELEVCLAPEGPECVSGEGSDEKPRNDAELSLDVASDDPWTISRLDLCSKPEDTDDCSEPGAPLFELDDVRLEHFTFDFRGLSPLPYAYIDTRANAATNLRVGRAELTEIRDNGSANGRLRVELPAPGAFAFDRLARVGDLVPGGFFERGTLLCPQGRRIIVADLPLAATACTGTFGAP